VWVIQAVVLSDRNITFFSFGQSGLFGCCGDTADASRFVDSMQNFLAWKSSTVDSWELSAFGNRSSTSPRRPHISLKGILHISDFPSRSSFPRFPSVQHFSCPFAEFSALSHEWTRTFPVRDAGEMTERREVSPASVKSGTGVAGNGRGFRTFSPSRQRTLGRMAESVSLSKSRPIPRGFHFGNSGDRAGRVLFCFVLPIQIAMTVLNGETESFKEGFFC
jgi:hypothetical protein